MFLKNFQIIFLPSKNWKKHLKKLLTLAEIPSFQKFLFYCPIASDETPSWNFPARAEPSRAGHFNFRAETELKKKISSHFSQVFIIRFCLYIMFLKKNCDHLLANKVFLELHYMNFTY